MFAFEGEPFFQHSVGKEAGRGPLYPFFSCWEKLGFCENAVLSGLLLTEFKKKKKKKVRTSEDGRPAYIHLRCGGETSLISFILCWEKLPGEDALLLSRAAGEKYALPRTGVQVHPTARDFLSALHATVASRALVPRTCPVSEGDPL